MKCLARRICTHLSETLVIINGAVSDELDLRDARDGLEIGMENRLLGVARLVVSVAIALGLRVKGLCMAGECEILE